MNATAIINTPSLTLQRKAGAVQAWTLILAMFLPIMAIVALAPTLPTLMAHFKYVPNFGVLVVHCRTVPLCRQAERFIWSPQLIAHCHVPVWLWWHSTFFSG